MLAMELSDILQFFVGLSILYVWLIRSHVPTNFRVGSATTLREEVIEVGFPNWVYDILRVVKPIFAFFLLMGLLYDPFTLPCMAFTTLFMVAGVGMHIYAKDNLFKMIPALTLLFFCIIIFTCPSKWANFNV